MPAPFRDTRPKIEWDEVATAKTPVGVWEAGEVGPGWVADRGWRYYGHNSGGPFLPFFGAPAVRGESDWGPSTDPSPGNEVGVFVGDSAVTDWAVLTGWVEGGDIYTALISAWAEKTFTGLTVGLRVGFRVRFGYVLDTGGGHVFASIEGETTDSFIAGNSGPTFWTFDGYPVVNEGYISTIVPASGEVTVRMGWGDMGPSGANGQGTFSAFELVDMTCEATTTTHRLDFAYPLEEVRVWRPPRAGSTRLVYPSGAEASWLRGRDGRLASEARWIPRQSTLADPLNDGWEDLASGTPGWQRFLAWARRGGNVFRFHPDKDDDALYYECVLDEPRTDPDPEDDMTRGFPFAIRTVDGSPILGY
jgi:hypothetical protein